MRQQISKIGVPGKKASLGIGYIYLPKDIDRASYVANCLLNARVSILTSNSERFDNVRLIDSVLNSLVFPNKPEDLGSLVLFTNLDKNQIPIIIGILPKDNETLSLKEGQFTITRDSDYGTIELKGDAKEGKLLINLFSQDNKKNGEFLINLTSFERKNKLKIIVEGDILFFANLDFNLKSKTSISLDILSKLNEIETNIKLDQNGVEIKSGVTDSEPMVLGKSLESQINSFISTVEKLNQALLTYTTTQTSALASSPPLAPLAPGLSKLLIDLNAVTAEFATLKPKIASIKSSKNKVN